MTTLDKKFHISIFQVKHTNSLGNHALHLSTTLKSKTREKGFFGHTSVHIVDIEKALPVMVAVFEVRCCISHFRL